MRSTGHVRHLDFGDREHVKCAMGPKQSLEEVLFRPEITMSEGGGWAARTWPPMSPKWLYFLVGMVHTDQWDLGGMSEV